MSEVFVVRNQLGQYWGKKKRWVDGTKAKRVATCKHQDEGFNLLVELSAKNVDLRGEVLQVACNDRGIVQVEPSAHLLPEEEDLLSVADVEGGEADGSSEPAGEGDETATEASSQ